MDLIQAAASKEIDERLQDNITVTFFTTYEEQLTWGLVCFVKEHTGSSSALLAVTLSKDVQHDAAVAR